TPPSTSGMRVRAASGLMRSTRRSPASMSTPASRYDRPFSVTRATVAGCARAAERAEVASAGPGGRCAHGRARSDRDRAGARWRVVPRIVPLDAVRARRHTEARILDSSDVEMIQFDRVLDLAAARGAPQLGITGFSWAD